MYCLLVLHIFLCRMNTQFWPCCFVSAEREKGKREVSSSFQLTQKTERDICSDDPWLILHKLDSPTKMRYIGARFAACKQRGSAAYVVPASIAKHVARIGHAEGAETV